MSASARRCLGWSNDHHAFTFAPVTAKYLRVTIQGGSGESNQLSLGAIALTGASTDATNPINLLAAGAKEVVAQPPQPVVNRLYWMVMISGIAFSGLTLLTTILFPLTEATMLEVRRRLDERRQQVGNVTGGHESASWM